MKKTVGVELGPLTVVGKIRICLDVVGANPMAALHEFSRVTAYKQWGEFTAGKYPLDRVGKRARRDASDADRVLGLIRERVPNIDALFEDYQRQFPVRENL